MLDLYLLRHGKAANAADYADDYDRPLNKKGIVQINQIGFQLENEQNKGFQVISSAALRTIQTTQIVNSYLGGKDNLFEKTLYLAGREKILDFIRETAYLSQLLYIGHNFGISDLASSLTNESISMSPGMMIHISFEVEDWKAISKGSGMFMQVFTPKIYIP
jgi:phosphohistidine phosphatase